MNGSGNQRGAEMGILGVVLGMVTAGVAGLGIQERRAVENGLGLIRNCQIQEGLLRMKADGEAVWCVPYCGNFAAMALLAGCGKGPEGAKDLERAERWLLWYAKRQHADGAIDDYKGSMREYQSTGSCDSTDAYAATYLMAVRRYQLACGGPLRPELADGARRALRAIAAVAQEDGLTFARPDYPMKYLMDNVEVAGGLAEGAELFAAAGMSEEAQRALGLREKVASALRKFWSEQEGCYAVAIDKAGGVTTGLERPYPDGLAQLFALAHMAPPRRTLWDRLRERFRPGDEGMPAERWLIAARRVGAPTEVAELERRTCDELLGWTPASVYIDRPALAILALVDGPARFADALPPGLPSACQPDRSHLYVKTSK